MLTPHSLRVVYPSEVIAARVEKVAQEINARYKDEPLVMVCVLKGAFMFFSDLVKLIDVHPEIDFVRLASYGMQSSGGAITFSKDIDISIKDKHVLIVEDVIDSGHTMDFLLKQFQARGAKSLRLAVLVDKQERREVDVQADFTGFVVNEGFIVGYGLDYAERYRELPAIYEVVFEENK
ncbi:hypoxanthine phosphoribosyltransferase [Desulfovibrio sp. OttesenSCG-928-I05]|nr:hypoxanthine phosphoribosyltransferase [Desulfovibrio sp. OttesenSCG-928-I05]